MHFLLPVASLEGSDLSPSSQVVGALTRLVTHVRLLVELCRRDLVDRRIIECRTHDYFHLRLLECFDHAFAIN